MVNGGRAALQGHRLPRRLDLVDAQFEPVRIVLIAGEGAQRRKRGPRLGLKFRKILQRIAVQGVLQPRGELVPLLPGRELILLLDFRRGKLVEELASGLVEIVGVVGRGGRLGLGGACRCETRE